MTDEVQYEYIVVRPVSRAGTRKTRRDFGIFTKSGMKPIGCILYNESRRQHVFAPDLARWSFGFLRDVTDFLEKLKCGAVE
jgi:hypothetical protein